MRLCVAGVGLRAGHVIREFKSQMPELEVVGYYDPQPSALDMIGGNTAKRYTSVEQMLDGSRPDLFFVGSPNKYHLEQLELGFKAGVRMFAEKPVVISMDETWKLAELLAKHGADKVMIGLVLRYSQHMVDLRAALDKGWLGPVTSLEANELIGTYHGAFFMRDWRRHTAATGGFMLEKCCHDLDIYNMVTGSRPVKVASFGGRGSFLPEFAPKPSEHAPVYSEKNTRWNGAPDSFTSDADIIDYQSGLLQFESGASMTFHTNLNVPDEHRRFCVVGAKATAEGDFHRGYLKITEAKSSKVLLDKNYKAVGVEAYGHYGADGLMARDIVRYLREETDRLPVSVVDAMTAGIVALKLDEARVSGQMLDLSDTWKKLDGFGLRI